VKIIQEKLNRPFPAIEWTRHARVEGMFQLWWQTWWQIDEISEKLRKPQATGNPLQSPF
jgi:hypothetical protein